MKSNRTKIREALIAAVIKRGRSEEFEELCHLLAVWNVVARLVEVRPEAADHFAEQESAEFDLLVAKFSGEEIEN